MLFRARSCPHGSIKFALRPYRELFEGSFGFLAWRLYVALLGLPMLTPNT